MQDSHGSLAFSEYMYRQSWTCVSTSKACLLCLGNNMIIESMYTAYNNYVGSITGGQFLPPFKSHGDYTGILEHVSYDYGDKYYAELKKIPHMTDVINKYCALNDKIGGGEKHSYGNLHTSPSNFRYLFQSHMLLTHWSSLEKKPVCIVEVGCGYGGLALAINALAPLYNISIERYCMIDLPAISELQKQYLSHHSLAFPCEFYSAFQYGSNIPHRDMFLISNYCFSEISKEHQEQYITHLFPKVAHGFMTWNFIPVYNFGFASRDIQEYPTTHPENRYVFF